MGNQPRLDPLGGVMDQFGGMVQAQFVFDVFTVGFDGLKAQIQVIGDPSAAQSLTDQPENVQLTIIPASGTSLSVGTSP